MAGSVRCYPGAVWNVRQYVMLDVTRWHATCCVARKISKGARYLSICRFICHKAPHIPTLCVSFLCRAGYLTLFGGEQNNNSTDPSSVYEEYKRFDDLLTKMARGTLKPGKPLPVNCFKNLTLFISLSAASARDEQLRCKSALDRWHHRPWVMRRCLHFLHLSLSLANVLWHHRWAFSQICFEGCHGDFRLLSCLHSV